MILATLVASISITFLPLWASVEWYECGKIAWLYSNGKVYVCEIDSNTEFYKHHEIGHYFYFNHLNDKQKKEYLKEYIIAKEKGIKYFHREYGMTNVYEDFAENFSVMVQGNKNLKLSKRILLIKKYLREE